MTWQDDQKKVATGVTGGREWSGLTLDELLELSQPFEGELPEGWMKLASAIEAKLKEKNI